MPLGGTLPPAFRRERDLQIRRQGQPNPLYARIGNNLIASNHSANHPAFAVNYTTLERVPRSLLANEHGLSVTGAAGSKIVALAAFGQNGQS